MKRILLATALFIAVGAANASVSLVGGTNISFAGYANPAILTDPQTSGLKNALLVSDDPHDLLTVTFLGKAAGHVNQFFVDDALVFDNLAPVSSSYGQYSAGSPLNFAFRDSNDGSVVHDGGNPHTFVSYAVFGTTVAGVFTPYTKDGQFDFVLGFNDSYRYDTDYNDLVVGFKVSAVPEPGTTALVLAGLGVMGLLARRRRND